VAKKALLRLMALVAPRAFVLKMPPQREKPSRAQSALHNKGSSHAHIWSRRERAEKNRVGFV
jgi:hypothetical protein